MQEIWKKHRVIERNNCYKDFVHFPLPRRRSFDMAKSITQRKGGEA